LLVLMIPAAATALLAMMALPCMIGARPVAHYNAIVNNLRQLKNQKERWAAAHQKSGTDTPTPADLIPFFRSGQLPLSVMGETYHINQAGRNPTATIPSGLRLRQGTLRAGDEVTLPEH